MQIDTSPLSTKYQATLACGIGDRGGFVARPVKNGTGFSEVTHVTPKFTDKPPKSKSRSDIAEYSRQMNVYRAEKAVAFRDALFAELAQVKPSEAKVEKLVASLLDQGIKPKDICWALGENTRKLARSATQPDTRAPRNMELAKAAFNNLSKLLGHLEMSGKKAPAGAVEVFRLLQAGLRQAIGEAAAAAPDSGGSAPSHASAVPVPTTPRPRATWQADAPPTPRAAAPWDADPAYQADMEELGRMAASQSPAVRHASDPRAAFDAIFGAIREDLDTEPSPQRPQEPPHTQAALARKAEMARLRQFFADSAGKPDPELQSKVQQEALRMADLTLQDNAYEAARRQAPTGGGSASETAPTMFRNAPMTATQGADDADSASDA